MKKLIAVLVVSAMVTTAVFAQASLGGMIGWRGDIVNNDGSGGWSPIHPDDSAVHDIMRRRQDHEARIGVNVSNGEGTAGAGLRSWVNSHNNPSRVDAWVWWQPMAGLRIMAGRDPWAVYGLAEIVGWGFNANNAEDWLVGWGAAGGYHYGATQRGGRLGRNAGFYAGFAGTGVSMTFQPIDTLPLSFLAVFPFSNPTSGGPGGYISTLNPYNWFVDTFLNMHLGFRLGLEGIGRIAFTWWAAPGHFAWGRDRQEAVGGEPIWDRVPVVAPPSAGGMIVGGMSGTNQTNSSRFYLSFLLTALQAAGMQVNLGVVYTAPFRYLGETSAWDRVYHYPMEMGLGFLFSQGPIRLAVRSALTIGGSRGYVNVNWDEGRLDRYRMPARFGLNLHPRFDMGMMMLHANTGFQITAASGRRAPGMPGRYDRWGWISETHVESAGIPNSGDGNWYGPFTFGWHFNPYISRTIAGPTRMFGGVHLESNGQVRPAQPGVEGSPNRMQRHYVWRVPVGIQIEW
jgi:hypothetical protein